MSAPRAVVISGSERYADPWHDFATTSAQLAGILTQAGFAAEVDESVDARLGELGDVELAVVNIGDPARAVEALPPDDRLRAGLLAHLAAGRPLLVSHVSSTSLGSVPEWEAIVGGVWVRGVTFHPDYGPAHVEIVDPEHPITRGIPDFSLDDERYTELRLSADIHVLAAHRHDGRRHPLIWTHRYDTARVVYDALGHDEASYRSPEHREILRRAALWAARRL
jgi:uncharacterized protein